MASKKELTLAWHMLWAIALVAAGVLVRQWPLGNMGFHLPYITFFPAVTIAALIGGRLPGIFAALLAAVYVYIWHGGSPAFTRELGLEGVGLFFFTGILIAEASEQLKIRERVRVDNASALIRLEQMRAEESELAQQKIAASEERYRLITDNAADAILVADTKARFIYANEQAEKLYGYSRQELLQMGIPDLTPAEDLKDVMRLFRQITREKNLLRTIKQKRKDGTTITVEVNAILLPDGNYFGLLRDITARQQTEDRLKLFRMLMDQSNDAVEIVDMTTMRFVDVNDGACRALGYTREEMLSKTVADIDPTFREIPEEILEQVNRQGHALFQNMHERKDGSTFPVEITIRVMELDRPYGLSIARDITERKQAEEKVAAHARQLEAAIYGTLRAVSNMVEARDPYTAGHERRVGIIAADMAREMGWIEPKCKELEMIGLVHDIGKIGMPVEILTKPGRLTEIEYGIIKAHAEKGYEILKDVDFPMPIAEIIRQHHERMDGSGYPQGLQGEQILPEARILAVADVLESMAAHRPYRPAMGIDAALDEIKQNRGKLYDPDVVDALLSLVNEKGYQLPE